MSGGAGWKLTCFAPEAALPALEAALEPLSAAIATFPADAGPWRLDAFGGGLPDEAALNAALARGAATAGVPAPDANVVWLPEIDWLAANRASFAPLRVGRYFIHDSDYAGVVPPGAVGLRIDAATAFGSGDHATTAGCLLALDALARRRRPARVLDLGCGSGILALAAARTCHARVTAVDVDPEAARVTARNARLNGVARFVTALAGDGYRDARVARGGPYDLILANILARPLAAMAPSCARALAPGGHAVRSGLLVGQEAQVLAPHRVAGLRLVRRWRRDGWSTLVVAAP